MHGPEIVASTLSIERPFGKDGTFLQYHSRSDHHSKVACWAVAFDMLSTSSLLREHVAAGKATIGVNHRMQDFKLRRKKDLDLVIARPASNAPDAPTGKTLAELATRLQIRLTPEQISLFEAMPSVTAAPVGAVMVALEAKACMTEHRKSESRLFDELNSSQQTVHGAADQAVAVALAMVNIAAVFTSPGRQTAGDPAVVTQHQQPEAAAGVVAKLRELPRRSGPGDDGFDAMGIMVVDLRNDGSRVDIETEPPAPQPGEDDSYEAMVMRASSLYDYRFAST